MPVRPLRRWARRLVRYRYWLLALGAALGAAAAITGRHLALDRSLEKMFAADDPLLEPYRRLQRTFGRHEVVLAVYSDPGLATDAGRERIGKLAGELRSVPGVVAVVSLLDPPGAADFSDEGRGKRFREMFAGYTHNRELDAAGVLCLVARPSESKTPRRETLAQMRAVIAAYPDGALIGEPVLVEEAFDLLDADGRRLRTWCTLLVFLTILACFRNVRWLVLPLAVVQLTLAATDAVLVLSGLQLSMVSSMLGAIVTVVGVASVVHVMVHYQDERRIGLGRRRALVTTLVKLAAPVTVAILTDSAGFAALMVSRVGPVHDFGLMMAIGSLLVLPACVLLVPGLMWLSDPSRAAVLHDDQLVMGPWLNRLLAWAHRHVAALGAATVGLAAVSLYGASQLELETDFTKNFRTDSPIVTAYTFVEKRFGGAGVWEVILPVGPASDAIPRGGEDSNPRRGRSATPGYPDKSTLLAVLALEDELRAASPHVAKTMSLADALSAYLGSATAISQTPDFLIRTGLSAMRVKMPQFIDSIYGVDPDDGRPWLHVLLRSPEQLGAREKNAVITQVQTTAAQHFPGAEATGYYVLMARLIASLLADQWKAFAVATVVVLSMMLVAIRDVRLTLVTFVPSVFPSLVVFGAMGLLGIQVNMGAAMIAAVSVGLSVDGSIHYTMFYQRFRRAGLDCDGALHRSQDSVGRAATFSTLALTVGFATLGVSDFVPTIYFGALVGLSMLGGLVGNIVVLPVLIRLVDRRASYGGS
jgi:predicted RND superfamily exporter protein